MKKKKKAMSNAVFLISYNLKTIRLNPNRPVTIGREKYNDVVLNDLVVSRQHASISWDNDSFVLKDLKSRNGVYLNDKRVEYSPLRDGDTIKIGSHTFSIRSESEINLEQMLLHERGRRASQETLVDSDLGISFSERGFSGNLAILALVEVVQTLSQCLKTGLLSITQKDKLDETGRVYFKDGEIIHAEHKEFDGFKAVLSILKLSDGQFDFRNDEVAPKVTIQEPTMGILMEACRIKDEEHREQTHS